MKISTNLVWREFITREEVPEKVLRSDFDWTDDGFQKYGSYSDGFIHYRRTWYHVSQFMSGGVKGWHGSHGDSFFSGVVIRLSSDGERYQIGTYCT